MAKIKITKRTVEALKVTAKDYIAFDTDLPGFGVRVMPSGKRFFLVQYRRHGRTRRVMIGQFGIVTAELARREATIKLGSVRGGDGDPAASRDAERQSTTMKELGRRFLDQHVSVRCKPSTQAEYRRCVELFLDPFFAEQRARSVTTADVAELHGSPGGSRSPSEKIHAHPHVGDATDSCEFSSPIRISLETQPVLTFG
jgi:hypothetical protein